jgi:RepB DNA-primase from phage plasmid
MIVYEFCDLLVEKIPADERLLFTGFPGDPYDNAKWAMSTYTQRTRFFADHNLYVSVMSSRINERGEWRRKKENFGHGLFLMIDDLGDGLGAKNSMSVIDALPPTMLVETSPGNHQAFYVFNEPIEEIELFEGLINGFIAKSFLDGKDPGMRGVNRVARLPYGINGKKKYGGHKVWPVCYRPDRQYTPQQIIDAFGIKIVERKSQEFDRLMPENFRERREIFGAVYNWLKDTGMLKKEMPDLGGKIPMTCPWVDDHTDGADSGTYLAVPSEENGQCGSFVCYHSSTHNDKTGWKMLLRYVIGESSEVRALIERQEIGIQQLLEEANNGE